MDTSYRIVGADGREYGPVNAEQVRVWAAQHRVDASTRMQAEGGDWKPLAAYPEFADALAAQRIPVPPVPPPPPGGGVDALVAAIRARDYQVDIGRCLGRGWELLWRHPGLLIAMTALVLLIKVLLIFVPPGFVAGLVLLGPIAGGCQMLILRLARGQPTGLESMFSGFGAPFAQLLVLGIVAGLLTGLGLALCLLPGLYLLVVWGLFPYLLVIDRGLDFWPALELSFRVSNLHFWKLLLFVVVLVMVAGLGLLACGFGALLTLPWAFAAIIYAYEDIFSPCWTGRP